MEDQRLMAFFLSSSAIATAREEPAASWFVGKVEEDSLYSKK